LNLTHRSQYQVSYENGDKKLVIEPLKGQIDPDLSEFTVGKVKVEMRLAKIVQGRWGDLVGDSPDREPLTQFLSSRTYDCAALSAPLPIAVSTSSAPRKSTKNWEGITTNILSSEKEKSTEEDPNVGGDTTLNSFFQKIFADADEDTRKAMMKSYQESGGTTLSTNWEEVQKAPVEVKPPTGSEWKKWS
jgi:suppressor of G2 allele of SKP1